jgi:hypothetical protein
MHQPLFQAWVIKLTIRLFIAMPSAVINGDSADVDLECGSGCARPLTPCWNAALLLRRTGETLCIASALGLVKLASGGGVSSCMCAVQGEEVRLSPEQRSASRLRKKRWQATRTPYRATQILRTFSPFMTALGIVIFQPLRMRHRLLAGSCVDTILFKGCLLAVLEFGANRVVDIFPPGSTAGAFAYTGERWVCLAATGEVFSVDPEVQTVTGVDV